MSLQGTITTSDYLQFEDYQKLVQSLIDDRRYNWAIYCVISFCTGLRFSDVCRLKWSDVLDKKKVVITAKKTQKTHSIPIGQNASDLIGSIYEKLNSPKKTDFIVSPVRNVYHKGKKKTEPITIQYVNRTLKRFAIRYRLNIEHFSTHTFRKTFGRYIWEKNGSNEKALTYLNYIFKHTSIQTTMRYLGITSDEISGLYNSIEIL